MPVHAPQPNQYLRQFASFIVLSTSGSIQAKLRHNPVEIGIAIGVASPQSGWGLRSMSRQPKPIRRSDRQAFSISAPCLKMAPSQFPTIAYRIKLLIRWTNSDGKNSPSLNILGSCKLVGMAAAQRACVRIRRRGAHVRSHCRPEEVHHLGQLVELDKVLMRGRCPVHGNATRQVLLRPPRWPHTVEHLVPKRPRLGGRQAGRVQGALPERLQLAQAV